MPEMKTQHAGWKRIVLVFLVMAMLLALAIWIVWGIGEYVFSLPPQAATIITVCIGTFASVVTLILTKYWERKRDIEENLRKQKSLVYVRFMNFWFKVLYAGKLGGEPMSKKDIDKFFANFTPRMIIWASDKIIREFSAFRRKYSSQSPQSTDTNPQILDDFENLMYTIRLDLGHKNENLKKRDLLAIFISDIDNLP